MKVIFKLAIVVAVFILLQGCSALQTEHNPPELLTDGYKAKVADTIAATPPSPMPITKSATEKKLDVLISLLTKQYRAPEEKVPPKAQFYSVPKGTFSQPKPKAQKAPTKKTDLAKQVAQNSAAIAQLNRSQVEQALHDLAEWAIENHPDLFNDMEKVKAVRVAVFSVGATEIPCNSGHCKVRANFRRTLEKQKAVGLVPIMFVGNTFKDGSERNEAIGIARATHIKHVAKDLAVYNPSSLEDLKTVAAPETESFGLVRENFNGVIIFGKKTKKVIN